MNAPAVGGDPIPGLYADTLRRLVRRGTITPAMRVLVVCGSPLDRQALTQAGFRNGVISNLDHRVESALYEPFEWSFQDAEQLTYPDDAFDLCIAHSGLHHCPSPHRALLEMYRVARSGVLVFEPHDSVLVRAGVRLALGQEYETAAVFDNGMAFGGTNNTPIPNYVYRWTEREIEKTIRSYAPIGRHRFLYFYATQLPWKQLGLLKNPGARVAMAVLGPLAKALGYIFPGTSNNFAFLVLKPRIPDDLFPWIQWRDGTLDVNREWLAARYQQSKRLVDAAPPGAGPAPRSDAGGT